jgi:hypothetical protein
MPCSPLKVNQHLRAVCDLHLQDGKISQTRDLLEAGSKLDSSFFHPEDGETCFSQM